MAQTSAREANFSPEVVQFINDEIAAIKTSSSCLTHTTMGASLSSMVRFNISFSPVKTLTLCCHLPDNYPQEPLINEIRSKTLGHKLTDGLTKLADEEVKKRLGERQILVAVEFVQNWIRDNPLCAAADEISKIKNDYISKENGCKDKIKLIQEESKAVLTIAKGVCFLTLEIIIPNDYPTEKSRVKVLQSNIPPSLSKFAEGQSLEIARQCVQPPNYRGQDKKMKAKIANWKPSPVFIPLADFLFPFLRDCADQPCPCCGKPALDGAGDDSALVRIYCGHLYHHSCLDAYMKTPPFSDGKPCLSPGCGKHIYHDKWRTSAQVMESRWAAQQAKQRELAEVADFLN